MKTLWLKIILLIVLIGIVVAVYSAAKPGLYRGTKSPGTVRPGTGTDGDAVVCTMDVRACPDGSYVGRTGPRCEFAACPGGNTNTQGGTGGGQGIAPYTSGIKGVVMLGPTCPVMRNPPDPQCADKPYETLVTVFRASDITHTYASMKSAADGSFIFNLPPGDYVLGAGEKSLPRCDHPQATVRPTEYTAATIQCDTGIR